MRQPHKHAELIKAWADGAKIQSKVVGGSWEDVDPLWHLNQDYRIKPEPKPDVISFVRHELGKCRFCWPTSESANVTLTFDGETGKLKKVEMINE